MTYNYNAACLQYTVSYPQTHSTIKIDNEYFSAIVDYYGNQGFDIPHFTVKGRKCNGYFWSAWTLMNMLSDYNNTNRYQSNNISVTPSIKISHNKLNKSIKNNK